MSDENIPFVSEIRKLTIEDGEVLVVELPIGFLPVSDEMAKSIQASLSSLFDRPHLPVIILPPGIKLSKLRVENKTADAADGNPFSDLPLATTEARPFTLSARDIYAFKAAMEQAEVASPNDLDVTTVTDCMAGRTRVSLIEAIQREEKSSVALCAYLYEDCSACVEKATCMVGTNETDDFTLVCLKHVDRVFGDVLRFKKDGFLATMSVPPRQNFGEITLSARKLVSNIKFSDSFLESAADAYPSFQDAEAMANHSKELCGRAVPDASHSEGDRFSDAVGNLVRAVLGECPLGHHLKDGPCRLDYCRCDCLACQRECREGSR